MPRYAEVKVEIGDVVVTPKALEEVKAGMVAAYKTGYVRALADAEERIDDLTGWEHTRDEVRAALAALKEGKQA